MAFTLSPPSSRTDARFLARDNADVRLYVDHCSRLGVDPIVEVALALSDMRQTTCILPHRKHPLSELDIVVLASALQHIARITSFSFENQSLSLTAMQAALQAIFDSQAAVVALNLSGNAVPLFLLSQLVQARVGSLEDLSLDRCGLDDGAAESLFPASASTATALLPAGGTPWALKRLSLSSNRLSKRICTAMVALARRSSLIMLNLCFNAVGDDGSVLLSELLSHSECSLGELDLGSNTVGDSGATALAAGLRTDKFLGKLNLRSNIIGDRGAVAFAEALRVNTTLVELYLGGNRIGEAGFLALAESLRYNYTLERLDLQGVVLTAKCMAAIAEALRENQTLSYLVLDADRAAVKDVVSLAQAVKVNTSLMELVSGDGLSAEHRRILSNINNTLRLNRLINRDVDTSSTSPNPATTGPGTMGAAASNTGTATGGGAGASGEDSSLSVDEDLSIEVGDLDMINDRIAMMEEELAKTPHTPKPLERRLQLHRRASVRLQEHLLRQQQQRQTPSPGMAGASPSAMSASPSAQGRGSSRLGPADGNESASPVDDTLESAKVRSLREMILEEQRSADDLITKERQKAAAADIDSRRATAALQVKENELENERQKVSELEDQLRKQSEMTERSDQELRAERSRVIELERLVAARKEELVTVHREAETASAQLMRLQQERVTGDGAAAAAMSNALIEARVRADTADARTTLANDRLLLAEGALAEERARSELFQQQIRVAEDSFSSRMEVLEHRMGEIAARVPSASASTSAEAVATALDQERLQRRQLEFFVAELSEKLRAAEAKSVSDRTHLAAVAAQIEDVSAVSAGSSSSSMRRIGEMEYQLRDAVGRLDSLAAAVSQTASVAADSSDGRMRSSVAVAAAIADAESRMEIRMRSSLSDAERDLSEQMRRMKSDIGDEEQQAISALRQEHAKLFESIVADIRRLMNSAERLNVRLEHVVEEHNSLSERVHSGSTSLSFLTGGPDASQRGALAAFRRIVHETVAQEDGPLMATVDRVQRLSQEVSAARETLATMQHQQGETIQQQVMVSLSQQQLAAESDRADLVRRINDLHEERRLEMGAFVRDTLPEILARAIESYREDLLRTESQAEEQRRQHLSQVVRDDVLSEMRKETTTIAKHTDAELRRQMEYLSKIRDELRWAQEENIKARVDEEARIREQISDLNVHLERQLMELVEKQLQISSTGTGGALETRVREIEHRVKTGVRAEEERRSSEVDGRLNQMRDHVSSLERTLRAIQRSLDVLMNVNVSTLRETSALEGSVGGLSSAKKVDDLSDRVALLESAIRRDQAASLMALESILGDSAAGLGSSSGSGAGRRPVISGVSLNSATPIHSSTSLGSRHPASSLSSSQLQYVRRSGLDRSPAEENRGIGAGETDLARRSSAAADTSTASASQHSARAAARKSSAFNYSRSPDFHL